MDDVDPIKRREIEARELRRAILDRLEQYRQLQSLVPSHAIDQQGQLTSLCATPRQILTTQ